jgi:hypothetical protein
VDADVDVPMNLTGAITSDRGLCGGINSAVAKHARATTDVLASLIQSGALLHPAAQTLCRSPAPQSHWAPHRPHVMGPPRTRQRACGGRSSAGAPAPLKLTRATVGAEGKTNPIIIIGDKGKALSRTNGAQVQMVITDWTKVPISFNGVRSSIPLTRVLRNVPTHTAMSQSTMGGSWPGGDVHRRKASSRTEPGIL